MIGDVNEEATVAAVRSCFEAYNAALEAGDVEALNRFFWDSPLTVRFGPTESLFGYDTIAAFRSGKWKAGTAGREIVRVAITAYGQDMATTNAVFRTGDGSTSRQSQTWGNTPQGWRIVSAHVSSGPPPAT